MSRIEQELNEQQAALDVGKDARWREQRAEATAELTWAMGRDFRDRVSVQAASLAAQDVVERGHNVSRQKPRRREAGFA